MRVATILSFAISLFIQVFYPLTVILIYRRRKPVSWHIFAYGAAVFAIFQLFTWLPLSTYLDVIIGSRLGTPLGNFVWLIVTALMTALVEESGRWCGFRYLFPRRRFRLSWENGIAYGLGHNALESMLLIAGLTFVYFLAFLVLSGKGVETLGPSLSVENSADLMNALQAIAETRWYQPLVVALERVLALPHQVAWSLLVMQSLVWRQKRWFGFAVFYHTSVAVIIPGLGRLIGLPLAEMVNLLMAIFSAWIIYRLKQVSLLS